MKMNWMDVLWLVLLAALAVLPPVEPSIHKQLILLAFGVIAVGRELVRLRGMPKRGSGLSCPAEDCSGHAVARSHRRNPHQQLATGPIYFLAGGQRQQSISVRGPRWLWTSLASAAYCSYLFDPALQEFEITADELRAAGDPHSFLFFLAAMVINRFV
jgi:hypothetical protein